MTLKLTYRRTITASIITLVIGLCWLMWVILVPLPSSQKPYTVVIRPQETMGQIANKLAQAHVIRSSWVMVALSRISHTDKKVQAGTYIFKKPVSLWGMLVRFSSGQADQQSVLIVEGINFRQLRSLLNHAEGLRHDTLHLSDRQILAKIGAKETHPEGLFFPSTYSYNHHSSDLAIFRQAYLLMKKELNMAWSTRQSRLPYKNAYQLLIMASLIEKETGHPKDRPKIAAVFLNRLKINMRLQTDPAVIYGVGHRFSGNLTRAQLNRDTAYNTYTRSGLTPTPIALPSSASLRAAAHPEPNNRALYFVSRGDGTSQLSRNLNEHNAAVRKYILKKDR